LTTALEGGEGSASRPGHSLPPGKTQYLLHRRLGGPQGRSEEVRKISPPPGIDPREEQYRVYIKSALGLQAFVSVGFLNPVDGTYRLSRNVGKELPLLTA